MAPSQGLSTLARLPETDGWEGFPSHLPTEIAGNGVPLMLKSSGLKLLLCFLGPGIQVPTLGTSVEALTRLGSAPLQPTYFVGHKSIKRVNDCSLMNQIFSRLTLLPNCTTEKKRFTPSGTAWKLRESFHLLIVGLLAS